MYTRTRLYTYKNRKGVNHTTSVTDSIPKVPFSRMSGMQTSQGLVFTNAVLISWVSRLGWNSLSRLQVKTTSCCKLVDCIY